MTLGILAIVFGHKTRKYYDHIVAVGLKPTNAKNGKISRGRATAGFVLGIISTIFASISATVLLLVALLVIGSAA